MDRLEIKRLQILQALEATWFNESRDALCVSHVMTLSPTTVSEQTSVLELVKLLHTHGFRHLLVLDSQGQLTGVLSDRDVIRCFGPDHRPNPERLASVQAAEIMSRDLVTVPPTCRLETAIDLLVNHGISCLPVIVNNTIRGIVTNTDLNLLLQLLLRTAAAEPAGQPVTV